jgi:uncharacterized membrane protein
MNLGAIFDNPLLFFGRNHLDYYISLMIIVAKIIKAPFFYVAVGSQANIEVQHPSNCCSIQSILAPVGVLLAVLGYAVGTYGAYACGLLLHYIFTVIT